MTAAQAVPVPPPALSPAGGDADVDARTQAAGIVGRTLATLGTAEVPRVAWWQLGALRCAIEDALGHELPDDAWCAATDRAALERLVATDLRLSRARDLPTR